MEFLSEYGLFLAKAITIVIAIGFVAAILASAKRGANEEQGSIEVKKLNDQYDQYREQLRAATLEPETYKNLQKEEAKSKKQAAKDAKKEAKKKVKDSSDKGSAEKGSSESEEVTADDKPKRTFVLDFDGDVKASPVESMREEISALLTIAEAGDEVVLRLESGGGMVHSYGLAASQLDRIRKAELKLTICVDKVAASGGYMMACVGDKILAAPFALVGSIGVLAQLPNFNRLLKKHDVDMEVLTAGEYKRTLTMFGENTEKGRAKFIEELEETHDLFKHYVSDRRPTLNIAEVATGEVWYGIKAIENQLIDEIQTSDEYLQSQAKEGDVYQLSYTHKKTVAEKLGLSVEASIDRLATKWWGRANQRRFW
ncbi:protease SohB [Pseudoteredinibacter isoporae]|uniref:Serine protease SohB n=1 Tax=Pseudoteredinibacter isoporae TaxID=570281 RepID=A0A7X0MXG3_9GAMM|nr:protease SohB [Pseudoteredinibacter isoporae]MBB6523215.1 serine protease SohB [Pseudoteredinibacter isoporae]NHO88732.1 protease SohB [Pseudoteredinibacter isoporae]NIB22577.1 protease SohB [Pseudoteredinibacter isoporae]